MISTVSSPPSCVCVSVSSAEALLIPAAGGQPGSSSALLSRRCDPSTHQVERLWRRRGGRVRPGSRPRATLWLDVIVPGDGGRVRNLCPAARTCSWTHEPILQTTAAQSSHPRCGENRMSKNSCVCSPSPPQTSSHVHTPYIMRTYTHLPHPQAGLLQGIRWCMCVRGGGLDRCAVTVEFGSICETEWKPRGCVPHWSTLIRTSVCAQRSHRA